MSSKKDTFYYMELQPGDAVQDGDQWLDSFGQWQPYVCNDQLSGVVFSGVKARRPIPERHQTTYEEVPDSRTTQEAVYQPRRERIAYEDLQPGDIIQEGDEWQNECGRWRRFLVLDGSRVQVRQSQRVRRPYNITQLQDERDEWQRQFAAERSAREAAIAERNEAERLLAEARMERDKAWGDQKAIQGYRDTALQKLTEARAELQRLQEVVGNLYNEPTARQVQQMLRTWATELDWSAGCFDSVGRDEIDTIQKTLIAVIERIETILNPEGGTDGE